MCNPCVSFCLEAVQVRLESIFMATFDLRTSIRLAKPRSDVFPFFANAANLEILTPPWVNFRILSELPVQMHEGASIDYTIRVHGLPLKWRTEITAWEPPYRFVDQQVRGPYSRWVHEHTFHEEDGKTLCEDHVNYAPIGGALMNWLFVGRDVKRIFDYRHTRMAEIFGSVDTQELHAA